MNIFKKIASGVKKVFSKVFGRIDKKLTSAVEEEFKELEKAAVNTTVEAAPAVGEVTTEEEDKFLKAVKLAVDRGYDFNGADPELIYGYERVQSYVELKGFVDLVEMEEQDNAQQ